MNLDKFSSNQLVDSRPKLESDKPVLRDGKWHVSGKMIVDFVSTQKSPPGHPPHSGLRLDLGYVDAIDEEDAVRQASLRLEEIAVQVSTVAAELLASIDRKS